MSRNSGMVVYLIFKLTCLSSCPPPDFNVDYGRQLISALSLLCHVTNILLMLIASPTLFLHHYFGIIEFLKRLRTYSLSQPHTQSQ